MPDHNARQTAMMLTRLKRSASRASGMPSVVKKIAKASPCRSPELCVGDLQVDLDRLAERHDDHPVDEVERVDEHQERENRAPIGAPGLRVLRHLARVHCGRRAIVTVILSATYSLREPR